jgi:predicted nuclease of predicted toxin-antitoxin system
MRPRFDQNLSPPLVNRLADIFPDAGHVEPLGLSRASDEAVWEYARAHGYVIVTKDTDFTDLSVLRGFPPKVIRISLGNCTTANIAALLRHHHATIVAFTSDPEAGSLELVKA